MNTDKLVRNFELLQNISKQNLDKSLKIDLDNVEKIINNIIPETLEKNAPPNFPELFFNFKSEYEKFKEFILYEQLIGKNVIALGGGFSSGKSSFLNSFLNKKRFLPSAINPSTSVPAYIVYGQDESVHGINIFDSRVDMEIEDIRTIAHGFGEITEDEEIVVTEATLGHILESLFIATPAQLFKNIAFLDTPGYSKPDTANYSAKTDEKIARVQLNSSNFILWFIQADAGTINEEDIKFINTLDPAIPKLFIVNKADKKLEKDLVDIIEKIKNILDVKSIKYVDVLTYSKKDASAYDGPKIKSYIENWNTKIEENNFAYNFKKLFVKCKAFYDEELQEEGKRLNRLNTALTLSDDDLINECLSSLAKDISKNQVQLKQIQEKLKQLQDEFFAEIKRISDIVGIEMPEPSEIDLIKDKVVNPIEIIKAYKQKYNIKYNLQIRNTLESLKTVESIINYRSGGSKHNETLLNSIKENLIIAKNEHSFNQYENNILKIQTIIQNELN